MPRKATNYNPFPVQIHGETYPSMQAAARAYEIPVYVLKRRLKEGWSPERAVFEPWVTKPRAPVQIGDTVYRSQLAAAQATGRGQGAVGARFRRGVPPELMDSDESVIGQGVRVGDTLYPSVSAYARAIGRPREIVTRAQSSGVPLEDLADPDWTPPWKKSVTIAGKTYPSPSAAAKAHGISRQLLSRRLQCGMTVEEAVTAPKQTPKPPQAEADRQVRAGAYRRQDLSQYPGCRPSDWSITRQAGGADSPRCPVRAARVQGVRGRTGCADRWRALPFDLCLCARNRARAQHRPRCAPLRYPAGGPGPYRARATAEVEAQAQAQAQRAGLSHSEIAP